MDYETKLSKDLKSGFRTADGCERDTQTHAHPRTCTHRPKAPPPHTHRHTNTQTHTRPRNPPIKTTNAVHPQQTHKDPHILGIADS